MEINGGLFLSESLDTVCVGEKFEMIVTDFHIEKVTDIMILQPTSKNFDHDKATNIT